MDELLSKVKANLIMEHTADDALLKSYISAAVSYAESYQHIPEGFYKENPMKEVEVYTDGACSGNPGPGGWGAVLRYRFDGKVYEKELSGGDASTTNNRMELTAFIEALRQLKEPCEVRLCSDSQYVINGLEKGWAKGWKRRGWKKADGSPALNPDLWAQALEQEARHKITYVWVKGHAGHPENERCDQLAVAQSKAHGGRQGT